MNSQFITRYIFLFVFLSLINAQDKNGYFSLENRLKFGSFLFCQGDYIRAIDEYNFALTKQNNDTLKFKIALAYQKLERYNESENSFKELFASQQFGSEAKFEYFRTLYLSGKFETMHKRIADDSLMESSISDKIKRLYNLKHLYSSKSIEDSSKFFQPFNQNESIELLKFYVRKQNLDNKSPALAAVLSAIIPGLGKVYTENYGDGITAFLLTGVLTFLAIDNFNADHNFRGWLFSGLAAYFYAGNIYGSATSAVLFNANVRMNFDSDLTLFLNKNNHFSSNSNLFCK